jgi:amino acid transporter
VPAVLITSFVIFLLSYDLKAVTENPERANQRDGTYIMLAGAFAVTYGGGWWFVNKLVASRWSGATWNMNPLVITILCLVLSFITFRTVKSHS